MGKRKEFTPEENQEMRDMYNLRDGNGKRKYSQRDLAKHFGTNHPYVGAINKDNPETGEKFESRTEYQDYTIRQKINPETGKKFESKTEYENYNARQRINPETEEKFESRTEYRNYNTRQRINPNAGNLEDRLGE